MKCFIVRKELKMKMYYSKHLGLDGQQNHWVFDRQEAKLFPSVKEARQEMRINKLKNVEVEKI